MVAQGKEFLQFICGKIGAAIIYVCTITGQLMLLLQAALRQVPAVNIRETLRQMSLLGADSLPIVLMTILFTGMVFSVQTSKEFVRFGASASAGGVVAIALGRELVPVLVGVVVAGRIGAAIAAEIGTMKVTEQIDALRVMATDPIRFLVTPRLVALVLMMPLLVVFANAVGNLGGWLVSHYYAGISTFTYFNSIKVFCVPFDVIGGMIKSCFFGAIIATVGCYKGLGAQTGAEGVGLATTASVVLSIILIFITNYFLSVVLYV